MATWLLPNTGIKHFSVQDISTFMPLSLATHVTTHCLISLFVPTWLWSYSCARYWGTWGEWRYTFTVNFRWKSDRCQLNRRTGGSNSRSWTFRRIHKSSVPDGNRTLIRRTSSLWPSHYIEWAIPAPTYCSRARGASSQILQETFTVSGNECAQ